MPSLPQTTYTPSGAARAPGYYDPNNPWDTGYTGQRNAELNSGQKTTYANWDYDRGLPLGAGIDPNTGLYQLGGGGGGGGAMGGGGSFLAGDAEYNQMLQDLKAQGISDKASRDAGIKRSFINFGLPNFDVAKAAQTTGIGDLASILDADTLALAANNKFSVQQRLDRALADRQRTNRLSLRQRGGVRSGESGFLAQRAQTDYETDQFDSTQKLMDYIAGAQAAYAAAERQRQMEQFQMALAAAARRSSYGYGGGGGGGYALPSSPAPPTMNRDQAIRYWESNPPPTLTAPSGQQWYGGFAGLESTPFRGKALDGLY